MTTHKNIDKICIIICVIACIGTILFMNGSALGLQAASNVTAYEQRLFDDTKVHTIDVVINETDFEAMIANASQKEYTSCTVVIDGEAYKNVAIRTKGNTSLSSVSSMNSDRYSFKIEFDHYDNNTTYYGLDKLSLNNIIQDTTYLKDYLSYHMMNAMGVAAPLSSFVSISINGETFGLYLAVEGIEEAFLQRNYGNASAGLLYKPDNMQMGEGGNNAGDSSGSLQYTSADIDDYNTIWNGALSDITEEDQERLINALATLDSGENLEDAIDIDTVLKYFVVHNFVVNFDSYTGNMLHNYYLLEQDGILSMIPWDYNLAFGAFSGGGGMGGSGSDATSAVNYPIDTPVSATTLADRPMLGKLLENEDYMSLYHEYFAEFIHTYFDSGACTETIDNAVSLIADYVQADPTAFYSYEAFETGVQTLKEFCTLRSQSISGQLDGSIPSTQEGQADNSSALIDASHISLSDMGSMGSGGGMGGNRDNMQMPQQDTDTATSGNAIQNTTLSLSSTTSIYLSDIATLVTNTDAAGQSTPQEGVPSEETPSNEQNSNGEDSLPNENMPQMPNGWGNADSEEAGNMPQMPDDWNDANGQNGMFGGNRGKWPGTDENTPDTAIIPGTNNEALYVTIGCVVLLLGGTIFVRKYRKF